MKVPTSSAIPAPMMCESSIWLPYSPPPPDSSSFSSIARLVPRRTVSSILASSSRPAPPRVAPEPTRRVPILASSAPYTSPRTRGSIGRLPSASRLCSASLLSLSKSILMPPTRVFVDLDPQTKGGPVISRVRPSTFFYSGYRRLDVTAGGGVVLYVYLLTPYVLFHNLCVLYHVLLDPYLFLGHRPL